MGDAGPQGDGAESRTEPVAEGRPVRRPQGGCPLPTPLATLHTRLRRSPRLGAAASAFPAPGRMPTQPGCLPLRRVHFRSLNAQDTPVPRPASGGALIPRGSVRSKGKTARSEPARLRGSESPHLGGLWASDPTSEFQGPRGEGDANAWQKVCVFWSHGYTPLPPDPCPTRRCPSRASVFSPSLALAPGTQQVFSNARPIVIKGALWSVSVSRYLGSPGGILSTSLGRPELGEGLTPRPCTLPAFPDPGWFVCPPPYCSLLTDHAQKGSG